MIISKSKIISLIRESLLKEGSKRDAQGLDILVYEAVNAILKKIKKVEGLNKNVTLEMLAEDTDFKLHEKIEKDIEHCFSELKNEGQEILEKAVKRTTSKRSAINKIGAFKIEVEFREASKPFNEGLVLTPNGAYFTALDNAVALRLVVVKSFSPVINKKNTKGRNYQSISNLIREYHEAVFHEIHHFRQSNELHTIDMRGAPSIDKLATLKKEAESSKGLKRYTKFIKYAYLAIKRQTFAAEGADDFNGYLEKASDFLKSLERIASVKNQFRYILEDFLRFTPPAPDNYNKRDLQGLGLTDSPSAAVFLIYYYFAQIEVEAWVVGMMRKARISASITPRYMKNRYKNMSEDEISFSNKERIVGEFYTICIQTIDDIRDSGRYQIKDMYENALGLQKIGIDLEALLKKHERLCDELVGLWFKYAIQRYGIFKEFFELEQDEIKKWRLSGFGKAAKGTNPQYALGPKFYQYLSKV